MSKLNCKLPCEACSRLTSLTRCTECSNLGLFSFGRYCGMECQQLKALEHEEFHNLIFTNGIATNESRFIASIVLSVKDCLNRDKAISWFVNMSQMSKMIVMLFVDDMDGLNLNEIDANLLFISFNKLLFPMLEQLELVFVSPNISKDPTSEIQFDSNIIMRFISHSLTELELNDPKLIRSTNLFVGMQSFWQNIEDLSLSLPLLSTSNIPCIFFVEENRNNILEHIKNHSINMIIEPVANPLSFYHDVLKRSALSSYLVTQGTIIN